MTPFRNAVRGLPAAFAFLTRVPVGGFPYTLEELRWSSAHFPLVGAAIGGVAGGLMLLCNRAGSLAAAAVAVCGGLLLTGALHEDGLADTADALGGASNREQLFIILRDSRIGVFGAAALCMALLLRVALLARLGRTAPAALVLTGSLARLPLVWMVALLPRASPATSKSAALGQAGTAQVAVASGWVALLFGGALAEKLLEWKLLIVLLVLAAATAALCGRRFLPRAGGLTGDFLGATEQVLECALLLVLALWAGKETT